MHDKINKHFYIVRIVEKKVDVIFDTFLLLILQFIQLNMVILGFIIFGTKIVYCSIKLCCQNLTGSIPIT